MTDFEVRTGDAFDVLPELPADHVHAVVTDPPYGLAFMGRDWDDFEPKEYQAWCEEWAEAVKRVLKPGGHLLAFSGNRTHHRLFSGVEDAGFEIRDTVTWHYGSGFPKALDVSKAIDKAADAEREVVGKKTAPDGQPLDERVSHSGEEYDEESSDYDTVKRDTYERAPATDAAEQWAGFKTALKPATEYVVVARTPLSEGTVAENVQTHGTGALNIDGCRIDHDGDDLDGGATDADTTANFSGGWERPWMNDEDAKAEYAERMEQKVEHAEEHGRYPSNVVFDAAEAERLDREVGELSGGAYTPQSHTRRNTSDAHTNNDPDERQQLGSGGPSRYFYTSKASKAERTLDGRLPNDHPTVKPLDLMEWLVRLVTAEGQTVCDPFAGSGTTLKAAKALGRGAIGIERQPEYADLARARAGLTPEEPGRFVDDAATTLEAYTDGGGGDD